MNYPGHVSDDAVRELGDLLPTRAAEDDPRSWGDADERESEDGADRWLRDQVPPHHG